jgi:hypothetical protein
MFTTDNLLSRIETLKIEIKNSEKTLFVNQVRLEVYEEIFREIKRNKPLTKDDMIKIVIKEINNNKKQKRINKIIRTLRKEGFIFNSKTLSKSLLATGLFRINPETKFWEIIK